jgi:hypothetical protein
MHRRPPSIRGARWIVAAFALASSSCQREPGPDPRGRWPEPRAARRAVEAALAEWRAAPPTDLTTPTRRPVMFVDQQRRPGRRLRDFAILGEAEADGYRRFRVRLSLADPDESSLVDYYVFGEDPTWVYRAEDFDMIMHMDKSMMSDPDTAAGVPVPGDGPKAEPGRPDRAPPAGR